MAGIVEDELGSSSVFADRSMLDFNWVPPALPHRDDELRTLTNLFRMIGDRGGSQSAFVTGSVGTGKTVLTKKFCADFTEACRKNQVLVESVHVNCRKRASDGLALHAILAHFDPKYPERGYSNLEMLRDLRKQIDRRGCHLIIVLDEADALLAKSGSELVYALTRFDDEKSEGKSSISLILVSAQGHLPLMVDQAARSTMRRSNTLELKRYNASQLYDILLQRAKGAFHKGVVADEVLELISEIAGEEGDARYAIELLEHAGRLADVGGEDRVEAEHVRAAKANTKSFVTETKIRQLGEHPMLVLKALARKLSRSRRAYVTTGDLEAIYQLVAEEHGQAPRAHTQFWKYLKELETAGWIRVKDSPTEVAGNTQYISLPDVPAAFLLKKLDEVLEKPDAKKA